MAEFGEWNQKGATLSDVTAQTEYGVSREFIIQGIKADWQARVRAGPRPAIGDGIGCGRGRRSSAWPGNCRRVR